MRHILVAILTVALLGGMFTKSPPRRDVDGRGMQRPRLVYTVTKCVPYSPGVQLCITGPFFATYGNPFE